MRAFLRIREGLKLWFSHSSSEISSKEPLIEGNRARGKSAVLGFRGSASREKRRGRRRRIAEDGDGEGGEFGGSSSRATVDFFS